MICSRLAGLPCRPPCRLSARRPSWRCQSKWTASEITRGRQAPPARPLPLRRSPTIWGPWEPLRDACCPRCQVVRRPRQPPRPTCFTQRGSRHEASRPATQPGRQGRFNIRTQLAGGTEGHLYQAPTLVVHAYCWTALTYLLCVAV